MLHEDSSNILQVMGTAFKVKQALFFQMAAIRLVSSRPHVSFQNIRSKMSIRAEELPKAFKAKFLTASGSVADYGAFDFKPGAIVREKTRHMQLIKSQKTHVYRRPPSSFLKDKRP